MTMPRTGLEHAVKSDVALALAEDLGPGDLTATLLPEDHKARAAIMTREPMVLAGRPWVDEVFAQIDTAVTIDWQFDDGDTVDAGSVLCRLRGPVRALLSGERTALNFLQLLSATATVTARYVAAVEGTGARILDTRKTVPGLRLAQKYAVRCGGGSNHRIGLFDAILIKENHIAAAGGITASIEAARSLHPGKPVEIEVESIEEMRQALAAGADRVMLDNFSPVDLARAVEVNRDEGDPPAELEASGGLTMDELKAVAETGVDYISVGALTKNVQAIDLSMRVGS